MPVILLVLTVALSCDDARKTLVEPPKRLSMEAAGAKVADHIRREKPGAQIDKTFAVIDLTTDAVWDQLHAQVVKVKQEQVEQSETFVLSGDKVERVGRAFGDDGVTSIIVADLAGDKRPLLIYSFAFGSGEHRSEIGILDLHGKKSKELRLTPTNFSTDDYTLQRSDTGGVDVLMARTVIGHVTATREEEVLHATIKLEEKMPDDVRRHLR